MADSRRALNSVKELYQRFSKEEIDGFLRFLLEGGADKRCSNVYRIIEQQKFDLAEAHVLLKACLEKIELYHKEYGGKYLGGFPNQALLPRLRRFIETGVKP